MSVAQYYNSTMYRHPQAMTAAAVAAAAHQGAQFYPNAATAAAMHHHGWYPGGYHGQPGQMSQSAPVTYCMQEEQQQMAAWHANSQTFTQDFQDYFGHFQGQQHNNPCTNDNNNGALPSPPITISGSEMSSPGIDGSSPIQTNHPRPSQVRSPYEWIKKNTYQSQPIPGWTRTKDKYRVVYTEFQRSQLEKEFQFSNKYITIKRKSELSSTLGLSDRQVKIWFQNRRAKERKLLKRRLQEMLIRCEQSNNPAEIDEYRRLLRESQLLEDQKSSHVKEELHEDEEEL